MRKICLVAVVVAWTSGCESLNDAASKAAQGFQQAMQDAHNSANSLQTGYSVRGRVRLRDGQTLTCFNGIQTGYLGAPTMSSPGEGNYDPRTGTLSMRTAAIPSIVTTDNGTVIQNDCDKLAAEGVMQFAAAGQGASAVAGAGNRPPNSLPFAQTELVNFFERNPQPGGGKSVTWPRVAITLLEAPAWGSNKPLQVNQFRPPAFGCWKFKARIWESERSSREIPAFHRCTDDPLRIPGDERHAWYEVWSGMAAHAEKTGSTGIRRTEGPNFPDTPLPVSQRANQSKLNPVTFTGQTIEGVLYATGIDMTKPDPRLWLNFGPQVEGF